MNRNHSKLIQNQKIIYNVR